MKILITGATGFLGSHLTKQLIESGHEVIILKRSTSDTKRITEVLKEVKAFNIDECSIDEAFKQCRPIDVVIHTATMYDRNGEKYSDLLNANVYYPLQVLEAAIITQAKLFINTDSFINKNKDGHSHLAGYALTKQLFLKYLQLCSELKNIRVFNLKLEHVYGPFDNENKFYSYVFRSCINNIPELKLTPGEQKRDFIHVNDVISAYGLLIEQKIDELLWFNEYELGTGYSFPVREFVKKIHEKVNSNTVLNFGALPYNENEIMDSKANNVPIRKLGWKNLIDLDRGIELTIADDLGFSSSITKKK